MIWVENPYQGTQVGWTWAQHVAAGYLGGTDYIFYPTDGPITAAADGTVRLAAGENGFTPGDAIILSLADGRSVNYREVASHTGKFPRTVKRGDEIGEATQGGRWPHIDATVSGTRVPFEPLVNIGLDPSGGGETPVNTIGEATMQVTQRTSNGNTFSISPGILVYHQNDAQKGDAMNMAGQTSPIARNETQFLNDVKNLGLGNLVEDGTLNFLNTMPADFTFRAPVASVTGVTLTQLQTAVAPLATSAAVGVLPTSDQLGEALTSTVSLVDSHVDAAFAGLTLKTT